MNSLRLILGAGCCLSLTTAFSCFLAAAVSASPDQRDRFAAGGGAAGSLFSVLATTAIVIVSYGEEKQNEPD